VGGLAAQILSVLKAFPENPQLHGRRLRELLDDAPDEVLAVARGVFLERGDTIQARNLVALLNSRGHLMPVLRDLYRVDHETAIATAQLAHKLDPGFERMLARLLLEAQRSHRGEYEPDFILNLLEGASGGLSVLPALGQLRNSEDARVRSSMALMLGKSARAQDWFRVLRSDPDPRVRANAIESLWGQQGPFEAACFESGVLDPHQRVVANSWLGLYLQGDAGAVAGLSAMAVHADPQFRSAGSWAMGRSKDPRFLPLLRELQRTSCLDEEAAGILERNAMRAIGRIRQAIVSARRTPLHLRVWKTTTDGMGNREAIVLASEEERGELPSLPPTAWRLKANGRPVWRYGAHVVEAPSRLSIGLLFPVAADPEPVRDRGWVEMARHALRWRRHNDPCALLFYSESPHPRFMGRTGDILKLSLDTPVHKRDSPVSTPKLLYDEGSIAVAAQPPESYQRVAEGPAAAIRALSSLLAATHRDSRLFVVLDHLRDGVWEADEIDDLQESVRKTGVLLHCVATPRLRPDISEAFRELSCFSGGHYVVCPAAEVGPVLSDLVSSEYRHYRLSWPESEPGRDLEVEVWTDRYHGKVAVSPETSHCSPMAVA